MTKIRGSCYFHERQHKSENSGSDTSIENAFAMTTNLLRLLRYCYSLMTPGEVPLDISGAQIEVDGNDSLDIDRARIIPKLFKS